MCFEERQLRHFPSSSGGKRGTGCGGWASSRPCDGPHEMTLRQPSASGAEMHCRAPQAGCGPSLRWIDRRCAQSREPRLVPLLPSRPRTGSPWMSCGRGRRGLRLRRPCTAPAAPRCAPPATMVGWAPLVTGDALGRCRPRRATSRYEVGGRNSCSVSEDSRRSSSAQWRALERPPGCSRGLNDSAKGESVDGEFVAGTSQTGLRVVDGEPKLEVGVDC